MNCVPCPMRSLSRALLAAPLVVLVAVPKTRHLLRDILVVLLAVPKTRGAASIPHGPALARHAGASQQTLDEKKKHFEALQENSWKAEISSGESTYLISTGRLVISTSRNEIK